MKGFKFKGTEVMEGEAEMEERVDLEPGLRQNLHLSPLCFLMFSVCPHDTYKITWEGSLSEESLRLGCEPACSSLLSTTDIM